MQIHGVFCWRSGCGDSGVGFADGKCEVLWISGLRSVRGTAVMGFADMKGVIPCCFCWRSGCGSSVMGFAAEVGSWLEGLCQSSGKTSTSALHQTDISLTVHQQNLQKHVGRYPTPAKSHQNRHRPSSNQQFFCRTLAPTRLVG